MVWKKINEDEFQNEEKRILRKVKLSDLKQREQQLIDDIAAFPTLEQIKTFVANATSRMEIFEKILGYLELLHLPRELQEIQDLINELEAL